MTVTEYIENNCSILKTKRLPRCPIKAGEEDKTTICRHLYNCRYIKLILDLNELHISDINYIRNIVAIEEKLAVPTCGA